jgi:hypothetical protein
MSEPEINPNDLTIQDLATMKGIIELASERSTFKAAEMAAVGVVYNKLDAFLKAVELQQKAASDAKDAEDQNSGENEVAKPQIETEVTE